LACAFGAERTTALSPPEFPSGTKQGLKLKHAQMRDTFPQFASFVTVNPAKESHGSVVVCVSYSRRELSLELPPSDSPELVLFDMVKEAKAIDLKFEIDPCAVNDNKQIRERNLNLQNLVDSNFVMRTYDQ
jgi:hypothetical protein